VIGVRTVVSTRKMEWLLEEARLSLLQVQETYRSCSRYCQHANLYV
jgi:hypothetical protein